MSDGKLGTGIQFLTTVTRSQKLDIWPGEVVVAEEEVATGEVAVASGELGMACVEVAVARGEVVKKWQGGGGSGRRGDGKFRVKKVWSKTLISAIEIFEATAESIKLRVSKHNMEQKELNEEKIAKATIAEEKKSATETISVEGMTDEGVEVPPKAISLIEEASNSKAKEEGPRKEMIVPAVLAASDPERSLGLETLTKQGRDDVAGSAVPGSSRRVLQDGKRKFPSGTNRNEATAVSTPLLSIVEVDLTTETDDKDESEGPSRAVVNSRQTGFGNEEDTIVKEQRAVSGCRCKYVVKHIQGKCTTPKPPIIQEYKRPRRRL
ncbi:unnamed protein product [Orchesella dallaii]|uniref:Uncharacterized protein n=1 Tax=Orchesella dallaii TaxID=48710 RepID=A0ABP1RAU4_9HEXA